MIEVPEIRKRFDELSRPILKSGRFYKLASFTQHGSTSTLDHVIAVAYSSFVFALNAGLNIDEHSLVRGALLHDYYLYDWHNHEAAPDNWHGFTHPRHALNNARIDFPDLNSIEEDIILHHMFPLVPIPPHTKEGWIVSSCDKACSTAETLLGNPYKRSLRNTTNLTPNLSNSMNLSHTFTKNQFNQFKQAQASYTTHHSARKDFS